MLNQFRSFGTVVRFETGFYGRSASESFNWLKIQYAAPWAARNATSRNLKAVGKIIVGVHPCRSFSTARPSSFSSPSMDMDTSTDGEQGAFNWKSITNDLTETEAREVEAGVDMLLMMRTQGVGLETLSQSRTSQIGATKARHASLYESWSQGGASVGSSTSSPLSSTMAYSGTTTLGDSAFGASTRKSSADQEDEDMAYILGRSLTSGGSLVRSARGRGFEREKNDFLGSTSKDQQHAQDQDAKHSMVDGGILSEPQAIDTTSVGFRPLFSSSESRGFSGNAGVTGSGFDSGLQQHHHQPQQQMQETLFGPQHHHLSLRRPHLGASSASDSTLFASSRGVLVDAADASSAGPDSSSPVHYQKRQRLSSSLFTPRSSTSSAPASTSAGQGNNVPLSQFGMGRDRTSLLIDDPALVDSWGVPLARASQLGSTSANAAVKTTSPATGATAASGAGGANGQQTGGSGSVISAVFNMAKKRLFWG
ncbi:hypothetical protein BC939DRAFT_462682 [Gamsiella multidivaricata]|uniref:uncharacterized protein n=1 Tax=Gamsiella multidivaricata TaxID=101098 RepID=UPI00221F71AF|nr:uncharacterized protein BC939DRAFT_462682 [Gamsiella multidivaricata]KAI7818503.1 hypothetical protein BC939DRAFT_462682 [Gamsiella multidivaricata]